MYRMTRKVRRPSRRKNTNIRRKKHTRRNLRKKYTGGWDAPDTVNESKKLSELGLDLDKCTITKTADQRRNPLNTQFDYGYPEIPAKYTLVLDGVTISNISLS